MSRKCLLLCLFFLLILASFAYAENPVAAWMRNYTTGNSNNAAQAVAADSQRNVLVAGYSANAFNSSSGNDFFTMKYDENGTVLWMRNYTNGNTADIANGIAVDSQRNVLVAGYSANAFNSSSGDDFFTMKYDENGTVLWMRNYTNGNLNDYLYGVAVDSQRNVIVAGLSNNFFNSSSNGDFLTIKYDENGTLLWAANYTNGNRNDGANGVAVDSQRNVIVAGSSNNAFNSSSLDDFLTIKYDENGTLLWMMNYTGGNDNDVAYDVAVDSQRSVIAAGYSSNAFNSSSNSDFFTMKYDENGTVMWIRNYTNGNQQDFAYGVAVDSQRSVIVTGYSNRAFNSSSNDDFFTIKYDENGTLLWKMNYTNGNMADNAQSVTVDSQRNVIVAGLVPYAFNSSSSNDFFVVKYAELPVFSSITYAPNPATDINASTVINVTANITAPENGSISSAVLQYKRSNDTAWSNATMANASNNYSAAVTHSAPAGNWTIQVWARTSAGAELTSNQTNISVTYAVTLYPGTVPAEGSGKARAVTAYSSVPSPAEATRGKTKTICITINNTVEAGTTLTGLIASVSGPLRQYLQVMPLNVSFIPYNGSGCFKMVFTVPAGMEEKGYNMSYAVSGNITKADGSALAFSENKSFLLYVYEFGREEASAVIEDIRRQISNMSAAGLPTAKVRQLFAQAESALIEGKYANVKLYCEELAGQIDEAYAVKEILGEVEGKIRAAGAAGLNTNILESLYSQAKAAFDAGEFDVAKKHLENAVLAYDAETKAGAGIFALVSGYWWLALLLATGLIIAFYSARNPAVIGKIKSRFIRKAGSGTVDESCAPEGKTSAEPAKEWGESEIEIAEIVGDAESAAAKKQ